MPEPECEEALDRLFEYIDHELPEEEIHRIGEHLKTCPPCEAEHKINEKIKRLVNQTRHETAPDALRQRVLDAIRATRETPA
ncbi:mycothiol system anti-sigma-R factor [Demequina lignilytica]|uniref:Mycothiol system anti-sigma-R factor n=1 Tax=Demequina lignilytica TaxID=3051663 RepID=A0AAW7M6G9_9MICO|nr:MULTISPECIES: mycothiol system anti-sigma-R factor [unclassified Demequina]MDN4478298.1 mycothiol system anti-sigma-R factor [Demequina sp. SYSU T00039-1]MDN4482626.1 mycothiol system anti-sigma-R factor [Demequina sp. SYSU T0a273]MDN4489098.1 mycothiol system anti-sigma-R factor [Demequina sp. SYSU T00039]MDN4490201.1 mycothiol system anti-sigma-R factor [Demequina sp. SYSU T00068]